MNIDTEAKMRMRMAELQEELKEEEEKREKDKKNHNFVQVYRENMPELRWLMQKHPMACSILFFLIEYMDNKNAIACPYSVLEDYFDVSRMSLYRGLKVLEDNGFIGVLKMGNVLESI